MRGDYPIDSRADDVLGRGPAAAAFAASILRMDVSRGAVVGVLGPWGSGKSSFVNLAVLDLEEAGCPVVNFNPWLFSGAEQLLDRFFVELAAQLKRKPGERLDQVAEALGTYGETLESLSWVPVVGTWVGAGGRLGKAVSRARQRKKDGIDGPRRDVSARLGELENPVVVVLDDIDRLSTAEIREVFKLVRLTASFPNVVYVLAFDRGRVEGALQDDNVPGRAYLEKILETAIDLPEVPELALQQQLVDGINEVVESLLNPGPVDIDAWQDVYVEIVRPLIGTMRDVRRYTNAVSATLHALDGQVAVTDVLALEAVRVFLPNAYGELPRCSVVLTSLPSGLRKESDQRGKDQLERLLSAEPEHRSVVESMISRLFPSGQRRLGGYGPFGVSSRSSTVVDRTVAHEPILRFYLERTVGPSLSALQHAESAAARLDDCQGFQDALASVPVAALPDVIAYLEGYKAKLKTNEIVNLVTGVLNLLPVLPTDRSGGMMDLGARFSAGAVAYRVLDTVGNRLETEEPVRQILDGVKTLSSRMVLLDDIGDRENAGHGLVSEAAAAELQRLWRDQVRATPPDVLLQEHDLFRVIFRFQEDLRPPEAPFEIPDTPEMTLAILRTARTETIGATLGSRAERREARLHWRILQQIFGAPRSLEARIGDLKQAPIPVEPDLLELVDKYLGGWEPDRLRRGAPD